MSRAGEPGGRTDARASRASTGRTVLAVLLSAWAIGVTAYYYHRHDFGAMVGQLWTVLFG